MYIDILLLYPYTIAIYAASIYIYLTRGTQTIMGALCKTG